MKALSLIDWIIFIGYLVTIFGIGVYFTKRQKSNEDYFVGGRKMNWIAVGISLFATSFSSISFLAYPREGAYEDYHLFLTLLFIPFVIVPLLWFIYVPLFRRHNLVSIYEYLEIRFNRPMRRLGTLLFAGYAIGWMGSMLYGMGLIMQSVMGLTEAQMVWMLIGIGMVAVVYTTLGGVEAVVWSDVLQTIILGGCMFIVLYLAQHHIEGGFLKVITYGSEHNKFRMFNMHLDLHERRNFFSACAFALFMYLPGYTVAQTTAQRYVSTRNLAEARLSLLISGIVSTVVCLTFFLVGTTLYVFYNKPGAAGFPELFREDQLLPHFVATVIPSAGLVGLLLAGLFAAAMSTIDSGINSLTAVIVYDWLSGRDIGVATSRFLSGFFGVLVIAAALVAPYLGEHLLEIIAKITGTFLGLLLGIFILGMFVPGANAGGSCIGFIAGALALYMVWTWTSLPHWWYGGVTIFTTVIVGIPASRFFEKPTAEQLKGLFSFHNSERQSD
ncbi:sodium/solute symporter [bacterium]|nr:sodium/solute symporter [bacterium]